MTTARGFRRVHLLDDDSLGMEARAQSSDHSAVRLWLRLLACSTQVEREIRARLRTRFGTTLPRFDFLAQLDRHPEGLRMNALSRNLMVTNGNITALAEQLVADGWVTREVDAADRRSSLVRLTPLGRRQFRRMAAEHESWLVELFAGFETPHRDLLYEALGRLRVQLAANGAVTPGTPITHGARTTATRRQERTG